ncbi:hypothetical protein BBP40_009020 [Aspergillus hancockii]|nr:hypothetical protein BBP40_009020 [Aspergillus hancockii]
MKKAYEYSELCDAEVCVGMRLRESGRVFTFLSDPTGFWLKLDSLLATYYPPPVRKTGENFKSNSGDLDPKGHVPVAVPRIAGGETVAIFLAAATFYLLRNDAVYQKLKAEIREQFKTYAEITCATAQTLPYLQAVISEGLIYPPGSQGFPRVSPGAAIDGIWVPSRGR